MSRPIFLPMHDWCFEWTFRFPCFHKWLGIQNTKTIQTLHILNIYVLNTIKSGNWNIFVLVCRNICRGTTIVQNLIKCESKKEHWNINKTINYGIIGKFSSHYCTISTTINFSLILLYAHTYYTKLCTHTKRYR